MYGVKKEEISYETVKQIISRQIDDIEYEERKKHKVKFRIRKTTSKLRKLKRKYNLEIQRLKGRLKNLL